MTLASLEEDKMGSSDRVSPGRTVLKLHNLDLALSGNQLKIILTILYIRMPPSHVKRLDLAKTLSSSIQFRPMLKLNIE